MTQQPFREPGERPVRTRGCGSCLRDPSKPKERTGTYSWTCDGGLWFECGVCGDSWVDPEYLEIARERLIAINTLTANMVRLEKEVEDRDERRRFEMFQMKVMIYGVLILIAFAFWHFIFSRP